MAQSGGGGKIVLFASLAGRKGVRANAAHAKSKWGVIGVVQSLAKERASHQIDVNAAFPGAEVVWFLVSKSSDHMTGQSLNVCGGNRWAKTRMVGGKDEEDETL